MMRMANVAAPGQIQIVGSAIPRSRATLIPRPIIAHPEISPGAKLVYSKLLEYGRGTDNPTHNRIAAELGVSPRSVRNYINDLKDVGLIEVRAHAGKTNSYRVSAVK